MWMGVGYPCPPVRNDFVTPRHLFLSRVDEKQQALIAVFYPIILSLFSPEQIE